MKLVAYLLFPYNSNVVDWIHALGKICPVLHSCVGHNRHAVMFWRPLIRGSVTGWRSRTDVACRTNGDGSFGDFFEIVGDERSDVCCCCCAGRCCGYNGHTRVKEWVQSEKFQCVWFERLVGCKKRHSVHTMSNETKLAKADRCVRLLFFFLLFLRCFLVCG